MPASVISPQAVSQPRADQPPSPFVYVPVRRNISYMLVVLFDRCQLTAGGGPEWQVMAAL